MSGLADARDANTVDNGDFAQVWKWKLTTDSRIGLNITESLASTATGTAPLVQIDTLAASTAIPLLVKSMGTEAFRVSATTAQALCASSGSASSPQYSVIGGLTTGLWLSGGNAVYVCVSGGASCGFDEFRNIQMGGTGVISGMRGGINFTNSSVAPNADPAVAAIWADPSSTQLCYRTTSSSEGSGQTNRFHNRTANQAGVGTNYTLTGSTAKLTFGTTSNSITLPSAGVFLLIAQIAYTADALGAVDVAKFKLYNTTDAATIGTERAITAGVASGTAMVTIIETVTTTAASKVIDIYGYNSTAARGIITSTMTTLNYVRLS